MTKCYVVYNRTTKRGRFFDILTVALKYLDGTDDLVLIGPVERYEAYTVELAISEALEKDVWGLLTK